MYQNYIDDNIKVVKTRPALPFGYSLSSPIGTNEIVNISGGTNATGRANQFLFDSNFDNLLCSVEMRMSVFDDGKKYYPFVATYKAAAPRVDGSLSAMYCILPTYGAATDYFTSSRCIIPRLDVSEGENQYVVVGYASETASTAFTELSVSARLHTSDLRVSQPSK